MLSEQQRKVKMIELLLETAKSNVTQSMIADRVGVHPATVSRVNQERNMNAKWSSGLIIKK